MPLYNPQGGGGGGAPAGVHVTHKFPFAFNTPNLLTGATAVFTDGYTPAVGDILHDAWLEIDTAWDGVTPQGDFGTFLGGHNFGWLSDCENPLRMDVADSNGGQFPNGLVNQAGFNANVAPFFVPSSLSTAVIINWILNMPTSDTFRSLPAKFGTVDSIKVVVSQDGGITGADPGSTQGAGVLYVVTSTPA